MNVCTCQHVSLIQLLMGKITAEREFDETPILTKITQFYTNSQVLQCIPRSFSESI